MIPIDNFCILDVSSSRKQFELKVLENFEKIFTHCDLSISSLKFLVAIINGIIDNIDKSLG